MSKSKAEQEAEALLKVLKASMPFFIELTNLIKAEGPAIKRLRLCKRLGGKGNVVR